MRIGILTGGGDAPGLNACIRAAVARAEDLGWEAIGIRRGWAGLLENDCFPLSWPFVEKIVSLGGTVLETSRTNPFKREGDEERIFENFQKIKLDALIAIGGDDTLTVAHKLAQRGLPVVGVPKTMDNDVPLTDYTIGYDTAVNISTEAIDRLHTTAASHRRLMVVEVMGRDAGWVAIASGLAGGAHLILIPEVPYDLEEVAQFLIDRKSRGNTYSLIVVSEAIHPKDGTEPFGYEKREVDAFGHVRLGGVGHIFAELLERKTGMEARATVLGHLIRSGPPTPFDRNLGTHLALKAIDLVQEKKWDHMAALKGTDYTSVNLGDVLSQTKRVPLEFYNRIKLFFR
ncbi:MAG: ATP-dependent 6-phosphofructokinase [Caldiserica bacterium]|jgi:6-phosphofructokinase 1|nr:ATP-dependent 6-phosphofructokinase [Caldisericota bacterium]MDH7562130.1 ATP-dependent 6-phosphofructokinase [Caldisericota bacterium]